MGFSAYDLTIKLKYNARFYLFRGGCNFFFQQRSEDKLNSLAWIFVIVYIECMSVCVFSPKLMLMYFLSFYQIWNFYFDVNFRWKVNGRIM